MLISLFFNKHVISFKEITYNEEFDDIRSILIDLCRQIDEQSGGIFKISGFGQEKWTINIRTDLPILLEQLPQIISAIELRQNFQLDFYEQGIERYIDFNYEDYHYNLVCKSLTGWIPNPAMERMNLLEVSEMFVLIKINFINLIDKKIPELLRNEWMIDWRK